MSFLLRLHAALMQAQYVPKSVEIAAPMDALPYAYWSEKRPVRLVLPIAMMRMPGAFAYGPDHPFVAALGQGHQILRDFYDAFQPTRLPQMVGLDGGGAVGADLDEWHWPWRFYDPPRPVGGEKTLGAQHGVAWYGPCSDAKVALEMKRLTQTAAKIEKHGFNPDRFGDVEGQLITDGQNAVFLVMGGKHRVAACAHLGFDALPVRLRPGRMPLVDTRTAEHWPMVASGQVAQGLAVEIAKVYIAGRGLGDVGAAPERPGG